MLPSRTINFKELQAHLQGRHLPGVVVDLAAFDHNARVLVEELRRSSTSMSIRIATKSIRVPALIKRVLESDTAFQGLMCFSADELIYLATQGFDDLLLAYPTLQSAQLEKMAELSKSKDISLVVDSREGVEAAARAAKQVASKLKCVIELDVSWHSPFLPPVGARRSSLRNADQCFELIEFIRLQPQLEFAGLMAYEGQVAGLQDASPFKGSLSNAAMALLRRREAREVARRRLQVVDELKAKSVSFSIVNGGGSGSLTFAKDEKCLTEVTVGSALVTSHLFSAISNLKTDPAIFVALEAVRSSEKGWVTCAGGGYVASGSPGADRLMQPVYPVGAELSPLEGCGEVQTPIKVSEPVELGSACFFRPAKAGEIAERFSEYYLWDGKEFTSTPTYRGLGLCCL